MGKKKNYLINLKIAPITSLLTIFISKLLELEGFILDRITGSHHIFEKGDIVFVIPVHRNRVKSIYIKRVIELIEGE